MLLSMENRRKCRMLSAFRMWEQMRIDSGSKVDGIGRTRRCSNPRTRLDSESAHIYSSLLEYCLTLVFSVYACMFA